LVSEPFAATAAQTQFLDRANTMPNERTPVKEFIPVASERRSVGEAKSI